MARRERVSNKLKINNTFIFFSLTVYFSYDVIEAVYDRLDVKRYCDEISLSGARRPVVARATR